MEENIILKDEEIVQDIIAEVGKNLQADGGNIELVEVNSGIVKVKIINTTVPVTFSSFLRIYKTREGISCGRCRIPSDTIVSVIAAKLNEKLPGFKVELVK
jgi:Fe-S cluster biogenesis protein NfuA